MHAIEKPADDITREERLHFLRHVHDNIDEQVRYSNSKASYILTTVGAALVGCGAALLGPQVGELWAKVLLVSGLVLCGFSGGTASLAIFPVTRHRGPKQQKRSLMFFGAIAQMSVEDYADTVTDLTERQIVEELSVQIHALSELAQEKYRWIRISTITLAVGLALLFGAFVGIFLR